MPRRSTFATARISRGRHAAHHREQPGRLHDRSDRRALDALRERPGKDLDVPVLHVNADDADACIAAVRLAVAYRDQFAQDVVIDVVATGAMAQRNRRAGVHAAQALRASCSATRRRARCGVRLLAEGIATDEQVAAIDKEFADKITAVYHGMKAAPGRRTPRPAAGSQLARRVRSGDRGARRHARVDQYACARVASGLQGASAPGQDAGAPARRAPQRCHRLGTRRGAGLRRNPARRDQRAAQWTGRRARTLLTATPWCTTWRPGRRIPLPRRCRRPAGGSRSTTARSPRPRCSVSSTAIATPRRATWCCGRRSTATSSTSRSRSSTSSSRPTARSGGSGVGWCCCCRTATRAVAPSTRARGSNGSSSSAPSGTWWWRIRRRRRSTSTSCAAALRADRQPLILMQPKSLLRLPEAASRVEDLAEGGFQPVIDDLAVGGSPRRRAPPGAVHGQDVLRPARGAAGGRGHCPRARGRAVSVAGRRGGGDRRQLPEP